MDLSGFTGTAQYYRGWCNVNLTDGVFHLDQNGMSWLVTDICSIVKTSHLKTQEFVCVKLKVNEDKSAVATFTDGNKTILYTQNYDWCDGQNVTLFYTDNVLMLNTEY